VGTPEDPNLVRASFGIDLIPMITLGDFIRVPRMRLRTLREPRRRASENLARIPLPAAILHHRQDWLVGFHDAEALSRSGGGPRTLIPFDEGGRYHADSLVHFLPGPFFAALIGFLRLHLEGAARRPEEGQNA